MWGCNNLDAITAEAYGTDLLLMGVKIALLSAYFRGWYACSFIGYAFMLMEPEEAGIVVPVKVNIGQKVSGEHARNKIDQKNFDLI